MVWQGSPSRLCSRDEKICCYGDALSTIFLLAFVPCFLLFVFRFYFLCFNIFLHPGKFIFFVSLRLCSSHLLLSASTYFRVRVLSACCVIRTLPHLGILSFFIRLKKIFRSSYFSGGLSLLYSRTRHAST